MGIGRASGEDRAINAAQQAIDSPLLEVSIDGARGILFNVIGGNDLSMHEINTAAETITNAADTDANIIFGATINPELEGEVIVTVVATGFDASYFAGRTQAGTIEEPAGVHESAAAPVPITSDMSGIDLSLNDTQHTDISSSFTDDDHTPNMWTIEDTEKTDTDTDASKKEEKKPSDVFVGDHGMDDELEKPSFLRRLTRRNKDSEKPDDQA
jgi:hypothetical protein